MYLQKNAEHLKNNPLLDDDSLRFRFKSFLSNLSNSSSEKVELAESDSSNAGTLNRLEETLGNLASERARFLASVALNLGQVAYADMEISKKEKMLHNPKNGNEASRKNKQS